MDCTRDIGMIIIFIIIIFLVIKIQNLSKNKEKFALTSDDLSMVRSEINRIYDMDVEAIRNLGAISKSLLTGTNTFTASTAGTPGQLTIPADNTIMQKDLLVKGGLTVNTSLTVNGPINFTNKNTLLMDILPRGIILSYNSNTPPAGWVLCDGTNGAPDLRGRFILGAGQGSGLTNRSINSMGGLETVTLTKAQMPTHSHLEGTRSIWDMDDGAYGGETSGSITNPNGRWVGTGGTNQHYTNNQGGGQAHENMPPFYVLVYIMKL